MPPSEEEQARAAQAWAEEYERIPAILSQMNKDGRNTELVLAVQEYLNARRDEVLKGPNDAAATKAAVRELIEDYFSSVRIPAGEEVDDEAGQSAAA